MFMGCDCCIHEFVKAKEWQEGSLLHRFFRPYGNIGGTKQDRAFGKEKPLRVCTFVARIAKGSLQAVYSCSLCLRLGCLLVHGQVKKKWSLPSPACCTLNMDTIDFYS
jgi:hypothetical protein